jgi:hypothetical protein
MPKGKTWRECYAPKIAKKISEMKSEGKTVKEMKKILSEMNPGQYGHMKKIWANEYMIQLGLSRRNKVSKPDKNQAKLWE